MIEILKQMQKALKEYHYYVIEAGLPNQTMLNKGYTAYQAGFKAIKELESQEPVAWLLTEKNINSLQVDSIQLLINRLKHAHHTDLCVRINGQDEWFQADWLKHMVRATPPQRTEQEPVQVSPLEFVEMVTEKEHLIGKPIFWAEWPNKEKNNA